MLHLSFRRHKFAHYYWQLNTAVFRRLRITLMIEILLKSLFPTHGGVVKVANFNKSTFFVQILTIFAVASFLKVTNAVAAPANPALVNGYTVSRVVFGQSLLEQVETGKWVEKSVSGGAPLNDFEEKFRTANTVSMIDKTRSLGVLIDVASKQASWFPISDPKQLNFMAAVSSATVDISYVTEVAFSAGRFRKVGPKDWIEETATGQTHSTLKEESSTEDTLTLSDGVNKKLHLNIAEKRIKLSWAPYSAVINLYDITSIGTTPHVVYRFAPELRFDRAAKGYPMSAQQYYESCRTSTIATSPPRSRTWTRLR